MDQNFTFLGKYRYGSLTLGLCNSDKLCIQIFSAFVFHVVHCLLLSNNGNVYGVNESKVNAAADVIMRLAYSISVVSPRHRDTRSGLAFQTGPASVGRPVALAVV